MITSAHQRDTLTDLEGELLARFENLLDTSRNTEQPADQTDYGIFAT